MEYHLFTITATPEEYNEGLDVGEINNSVQKFIEKVRKQLKEVGVFYTITVVPPHDTEFHLASQEVIRQKREYLLRLIRVETYTPHIDYYDPDLYTEYGRDMFKYEQPPFGKLKN